MFRLTIAFVLPAANALGYEQYFQVWRIILFLCHRMDSILPLGVYWRSMKPTLRETLSLDGVDSIVIVIMAVPTVFAWTLGWRILD